MQQFERCRPVVRHPPRSARVAVMRPGQPPAAPQIHPVRGTQPSDCLQALLHASMALAEPPSAQPIASGPAACRHLPPPPSCPLHPLPSPQPSTPGTPCTTSTGRGARLHACRGWEGDGACSSGGECAGACPTCMPHMQRLASPPAACCNGRPHNQPPAPERAPDQPVGDGALEHALAGAVLVRRHDEQGGVRGAHPLNDGLANRLAAALPRHRHIHLLRQGWRWWSEQRVGGQADRCMQLGRTQGPRRRQAPSAEEYRHRATGADAGALALHPQQQQAVLSQPAPAPWGTAPGRPAWPFPLRTGCPPRAGKGVGG